MKYLVILCCYLVLGTRAALEEGGETEVTAEVPDCARSLETIEAKIEAVFSEEDNVSINCISYDNSGALRVAIASGFGANSSSDRYRIECRSGVLIAERSNMPASDSQNTSCLECQDTVDDICMELCAPLCERCYNESTICSRCSYCTATTSESCEPSEDATVEELVSFTSSYCGINCGEEDASEANHDLFNFCECGEYRRLLDYGVAREEANVGACEVAPECEDGLDERVANFRCVEECEDGYLPEEETHICFACGLEYCIECDENNHCEKCMAETFLFEEECFACPMRTVAECAFIQEEEVLEEENENRLRSIELAATLPIVSVLVIVFFLIMSYIAHKRYPHISIHGHKRHRKPQAPPEEEESEPEVASPTGKPTRGRTTRGRTVRSVTSPPPPDAQNVWRSRPTVRFR